MLVYHILASFCLATSLFQSACSQFPATCNQEENLMSKTCCPNNCGAENMRGICTNITEEVRNQWQVANSTVSNILLNAPNTPEKGTADARYLWPTVVFERVCKCNGNYGGADCNTCDFGWTDPSSGCTTRKQPVVRKNFGMLNDNEKRIFVDATLHLKNEMGFWSVIVGEPPNYTSGRVTLQNVTTYNFFIFLHNYVARDGKCRSVNNNIILDFAHSGPVFPVWHRRYILIVEREFQRILDNPSFGLPYWRWEENDLTPFTPQYYGIPSHNARNVPVTGDYINESSWHSICDLTYQEATVSCTAGWKPCNVSKDLLERKNLERGIKQVGTITVSGDPESYLPNRVELMIVIAAPSYDAADPSGMYSRDDHRRSFRGRLEGWNRICSAFMCVSSGQDLDFDHAHNVVHDRVGGQMGVVPPAINDPIFNLHHCNVDRIFESWMQRFLQDGGDPQQLLPAYVPGSRGHPGHNRDDFMVPFFPLIKAGDQYKIAEEWGYMYDNTIPPIIPDGSIPNCLDGNFCPTCNSSGDCMFNCSSQIVCPLPTDNFPRPVAPQSGAPLVPAVGSEESNLAIGLGLGLGLGILLLIAICVIIVMAIVIAKLKNPNTTAGTSSSIEMTVKT